MKTPMDWELAEVETFFSFSLDCVNPVEIPMAKTTTRRKIPKTTNFLFHLFLLNLRLLFCYSGLASWYPWSSLKNCNSGQQVRARYHS